MKLRSLAEITEQRLTRLPSELTKSVEAALLHAHARVFGRGSSRSPNPTKPQSPARPVHVKEYSPRPALFIPQLPPQTEILLQSDSSPALSESCAPLLSPPEPLSPVLLPTPKPASPPQPHYSPPSEPEADPPSPDITSDEHTFLPSRHSLSIGSRFSQRTTEITADVIAFEEPLSNRKQLPRRNKPKKHTSDADLEQVRRMNEEWERKQQLLAMQRRESQEKELVERLQLAQAEAEKKGKLLEERRRKLAAQREAARAEKERREALLRQSSDSPEPLHRRMESNFKAISEQEELEYHRKLQAIKDFMQPIQLSSLIQHRNWYEGQKAALVQRKAKERAERIGAILRENMSNSYYKAKALQVLAEEERLERVEMEERQKYPISVRAKQREYALITKEKHKPVLLPESRRKPSVEKRRKRAISAFFRPADITERQKTVRTSHRVPSLSPDSQAKSAFRVPSKQAFRLPSKPPTQSDSILRSKPAPRYHNYLSDVQSLSTDQRKALLDYQPRLRGQSSVQELKEEADRLGRRAERREGQLRRLGRDVQAQIQACDSVSAMYIDSIKAKLQVLAAVSASF